MAGKAPFGSVTCLRGNRAKPLSGQSHIPREMGNSSRSHHLLKHSLPEVDVLHHFGSIEPKEVSREINKLGQRDLQGERRRARFAAEPDVTSSVQALLTCVPLRAGQVPGGIWDADVLQ